MTLIASREPLTGDFVARRLARTEVILCAAPEYLERRGRPQHPVDLQQHETLLPPQSELQRGVTFYHHALGEGSVASEAVTLVPHRSVLSTHHNDTRYAAALHGLGVAALPSYQVEDALFEHALERVLPEWRLYSMDIWATMPTRKHLPARTRAFLDFMLAAFGGADHDPWLAAAGCETPRRP